MATQIEEEELGHGISFWEFCAETEADATAFIAELKEKGYDVEESFHATQGTDGRFHPTFYGLTEGWTVSVYMDFECVSQEVQNALTAIAEKHEINDWGSEPSTSFDHDDRDASRSAHL